MTVPPSPPLTLDALNRAREEVVCKICGEDGMEIVASRLMPAGYSAIVGRNSMALFTPSGVAYFKRRDELSNWEPMKP